MSYNLLDNFKEQGWDFLIPLRLEKTPSGEYVDIDSMDDDPKWKRFGSGSKSERDFGIYEPEIWDPESDYTDDYTEYEIIEEAEDERPHARQDEEIYDNPETLYDLKWLVDCDMLSDEEFLSMSAGDLIGISNAQLKFVSYAAMKSAGIGKYRDLLATWKGVGSIEQTIKLVNAIARINYSGFNIDEYDDRKDARKKYEKYLINIVTKHTENESVELIRLHKDYIVMLPFALIINDEHRQNGEPYFEYELYPKPSRIKDLHDKASRDYGEYKSREAEKDEKETNMLIESFITSPQYRRNLFKDERYSVIAVTCVQDILDEAKNLKHCVASYISKFTKGESYLYFIRTNDRPNESLYTVELREIENHEGKMRMTQCYGYKDTTEKSDYLRQFIYKWCKTKKIKIDCPV